MHFDVIVDEDGMEGHGVFPSVIPLHVDNRMMVDSDSYLYSLCGSNSLPFAVEEGPGLAQGFIPLIDKFPDGFAEEVAVYFLKRTRLNRCA
jgi:hypothetical protein